jgi:hypothetical protein
MSITVRILLGIGAVALVSAIGDYVWYEIGVRHRMVTGIVHGAVLLAAVGGVVGVAAGRVLVGIPVGALAGVSGALVYYGIVSIGGRGSGLTAMVIAWATLWVMLAVLDARVLRASAPRPWKSSLIRGFVAAALGGVAFYLMVDTLWGRPPAGGRNYITQFGAWVVAWAPGLLALTLGGSYLSPSGIDHPRGVR